MSLPQYQEQPRNPLQEEKNRLATATKNIKRRIGIHAGKGGVGKTFFAVQLARLLNKHGMRVGLLDADVDCPNIPDALNHHQELSMTPEGLLQPAVVDEIQVVSTGFMQDDEEPIMIRGPIKHRLLTDFLEKTAWGTLDILIIDFPPGTSDVPLSAMQVANLDGVIIITTPAKSSVRDATKAIHMAEKNHVPIIGIIENMAGNTLGTQDVKELAEKTGQEVLGSIPLQTTIREDAEQGKIVLNNDLEQQLLKRL